MYHIHACIHSQERENEPQAIAEADEKADFHEGFVDVSSVEEKGEEVNTGTIELLYDRTK